MKQILALATILLLLVASAPSTVRTQEVSCADQLVAKDKLIGDLIITKEGFARQVRTLKAEIETLKATGAR